MKMAFANLGLIFWSKVETRKTNTEFPGQRNLVQGKLITDRKGIYDSYREAWGWLGQYLLSSAFSLNHPPALITVYVQYVHITGNCL